MSRRRRPVLPFALLLSLAVHAVGLVVLPIAASNALLAERQPIEVALLPPPERPQAAAREADALRPRQIVAPPDEINDQPPKNPRFESDRDNTVLHETVREGVPNPAPAVAAARKPAPPAPKTAPQRQAERADHDEEPARHERAPRNEHAPALDDLFASTDELVRAQRAAPKAQEDAPSDSAGNGRRRLALAVPPVAPEWQLPGVRGTFDHLPDIQRGNVTLLNTKANVFAPFVRRVGERVFQHLIIRQRRLEIEQILTARAPVQMHVLLDRSGKLKSVRVDTQSGSVTMDDTLSDAVHTAAFDNNPPTAAANADGEYEFVFQAQLRAFEPGPGGQPSRIESRLAVALM